MGEGGGKGKKKGSISFVFMEKTTKRALKKKEKVTCRFTTASRPFETLFLLLFVLLVIVCKM